MHLVMRRKIELSRCLISLADIKLYRYFVFGVFLKYYMFCFFDIDWLNGALLSDLQPQLPPRGSWYRGQGTIHRAFIPPAIYPPFIYPPLPSPLIPHPSNHHTMVFRNQVYQEFTIKVWVSSKYSKKYSKKNSKKLPHSKKYSKKEMHFFEHSKKYS